MTKEIQLTKGYCAVVDDEDFEEMSQYKWCAVGRGYALNRKLGLMHRHLLQAPEGMEVDHIDGDPGNNRRANLRLATRSENMYNSRKRKDNTSGFKGVSWSARDKRWAAYIHVNGSRRVLGYFLTKEEASCARAEASSLHGEYSRLE